MHQSRLLLGCSLAAVLACADSHAPGGVGAAISIVPVFNDIVAQAAAADRLRITVERVEDEVVVAETTVEIDPVTGQAGADVQVELTESPQLFLVILDVFDNADGTVLYSGEQVVEVFAGVPSANTPPVEIPVVYVGPVGTSDPVGDTFETALSAGLVVPDVTSFSGRIQGADLIVEIEFVNPVVSPLVTNDPNIVVGYIEIDADQDINTGGVPFVDSERPAQFPGSTGMGFDYSVPLFAPDQSGRVEVFEYNGEVSIGLVTPLHSGNTLSVTIPLSLLGNDDGNLYLATVLGTLPEPTDIAPNDGHVTVGGEPTLSVNGLVNATLRTDLTHLKRMRAAWVPSGGRTR